jgi:DUF1680 family protein
MFSKKLVVLCGLITSFLPSFGQQQPAIESIKSFPLQAVRLKEGPFLNAQNVDMKYILDLDVDRLLAPYRIDAGLPLKAERYGNWENSGLDGHIGGHYLSALALMYASTNNPVLLQRLDYMVGELALCQQKNGDGYVGGIPQGKVFWARIAKGDLDGSGFGLNNTWVPLYNIHKLFAGLYDAYTIAGNRQALDVLLNLSNWFANTIQNLSDEQIQKMLRTEHGGMNEVFADIYEITQDKKYLDIAQKISHRAILNPLIEQKDALTGLHANTQIPKVIGFQKIASLTNNPDWAKASVFFWQNVSQKRSVSFGGNSFREHFNPINDFGPMLESNQGPETCNSYNMLKLTKSIFLSNPQASYIDFFERTLFNHILSSQHPTHGGFVYFTPIRPRHYRVYSQPQQGFWCCVGSGLENHGKYGDLIYAHSDNDVYVNLFMASTLNWKEKGLTLTQNTQFPASESTELSLKLIHPKQFTVYIRYPKWVKPQALKITINGKNIPINNQPSSYVALTRTWKSGDKIRVILPMETTAEALPDGSPWVSFLHGPIVLAAATDTTDLQGIWANDSRMGHEASGKLYPLNEAPILVSNSNNYLSEIKPISKQNLSFSLGSLVYPQKYQTLKLVPFYQIHEARYMLYWPVMTQDQLGIKIKEIQEQEKLKLALEQQTIDQIALGEQQPEADHNFRGNQTNMGGELGNFWRSTTDWMSYDLRNTEQKAQKLRLRYASINKPRVFDIVLNNTVLQTVRLEASNTKKIIEVDYELPADIKNSVSIALKIVAKNQESTGPIYEIRLLK